MGSKKVAIPALTRFLYPRTVPRALTICLSSTDDGHRTSLRPAKVSGSLFSFISPSRLEILKCKYLSWYCREERDVTSPPSSPPLSGVQHELIPLMPLYTGPCTFPCLLPRIFPPLILSCKFSLLLLGWQCELSFDIAHKTGQVGAG